LILVATYVPLEPLAPRCEPRRHADTVEVGGQLTPEFRSEFKHWLRSWNVSYWDIGGAIRVPILSNPFEPDRGAFRPYVFDMSTKIAMSLARESTVRFMIERGLLPSDYQIPEHVKPLSALVSGPSWPTSDQWELAGTCAFIRTVALKGPTDATQ
jgi:hypothetical protein